jgi:hypothetical protein
MGTLSSLLSMLDLMNHYGYKTAKCKHGDCLKLRFGLTGEAPMNRRQLAQLKGLTVSRIGQIENRALRMLRHPSRFQHLRRWFGEPEARQHLGVVSLMEAVDIQFKTKEAWDV